MLKKYTIQKIIYGLIAVVFLLLITLIISSNSVHPKSLSPTARLSVPHALYGVNVEMSQLLPGSIHYVKNAQGEDLIDIANHLGINLFRITNGTRSYADHHDAIYSQKEWNQVLDKMQQKGIKAIIQTETASNNADLYSKTIHDVYLHLVQKYLLDSQVLSHPDVIAVDINNEPILTDHNIMMMSKAAQMIKNVYPHMPLTVGWWGVDTMQQDNNGNEIYNWDDYTAGQKLDPFIDFYSIHMYGFDQKKLGEYPDPYIQTMKFIFQVKFALHTDKQILIEEFGSANGDAISDQDTLGSLQQQANTFAGVYRALQDLHDQQIIGTSIYQFYQRDQSPDAWVIIKDQGNYLFPAAYVIQKYATGKSDVSLSLPFSQVPNDYMITENDNGSTITVAPNDIIGFSLSLPENASYVLINTNSDSLSLSEPLLYRPEIKKYYAVFHALKAGIAVIAIKKSPSCIASPSSDQCHKAPDVFRVSIKVKKPD